MPRQTLMHVDKGRADELAADPRFAHLYFRLPRSHPLMQHDGPSIYVMANTKRQRAYVCVAEKHTPAAVRAQIGRLRRYIRVEAGVGHFGPKPGALIANDGSLSIPDDLARDWADGPEAFSWRLVCALPDRYWLDPKFGHGATGKREYTRCLNRLRREVIDRLTGAGWTVYNNVETRGMGVPGFRLAWLERRRRLDDDLQELRQNHLDWLDICATDGPGVDPRMDPNDADVQRAYARYQALTGRPLPKPGDRMPGHKSSDRYQFNLPEGQLTIRCAPECPRHINWSTDQTDA